MNSYLATFLLLILFVLRFLAPLGIIVLLGFFASWFERRWFDPGVPGSPPAVSRPAA